MWTSWCQLPYIAILNVNWEIKVLSAMDELTLPSIYLADFGYCMDELYN
ncbi:hypothetical protein [Nostoc sp. TCL240-02]|nr:hypothetical protein [Nostoc sp. TCL240-02]